MADEQEVGVIFPLAGLETTCEFGRQPVDTAAEGVNVRAYESVTGRARGGSRSGLSKYIPDQVNGVTYQVQHLNILVDPQQPALDAPTDGPVADPSTNNLSVRNPGRGIRRGGSGRVPNRHVGGTVTGGYTFIQKTANLLGNVNTTQTVLLDTIPNVGDLIVVFTRTSKAGLSTPEIGSVKNVDGVAFAQIGGAGYYAEATIGTSAFSLAGWYKVAQSASDQTIKIEPGGLANTEYAIVVYRALGSSGPFTDKVKSQVSTSSLTLSLIGLPLDGTDDQLEVICIMKSPSGLATIVSSGFTARYGLGSGGSNLDVADNNALSGVAPVDYSESVSIAVDGYVGIMAAFHV